MDYGYTPKDNAKWASSQSARDIAVLQYQAERHDNLIALINTWNEATSPYTLRSDKEHAIERARAKTAMAAIKRNYVLGVDYKELSSGALWRVERA